ncbi:MAG: ABC transporter permease, partial [Pseudomonadota bacterium]
MTRSIALLDLRRFLVTPGFWVIAAFLQFSLAWLLFVYLDRFRALNPSLGDGQTQRGVTDLVATPVLLDATTLLMLVAPLLAMRSFSEERKSGSLVLLLASPVRTAQIVTGKILALMIVLLVPALLTLALVISLSLGTDLDWGKIASGFTGLVLTLTLAASAGAWISALTRHPPVAAALQYALFLMLW